MTEYISLDSPRLHISPDILRNPPAGITIDWSTAESPCFMVKKGKLCNESCMKGVLVKVAHPKRVWELTGKALTRDLGGGVNLVLGYEGIWPD